MIQRTSTYHQMEIREDLKVWEFEKILPSVVDVQLVVENN